MATEPFVAVHTVKRDGRYHWPGSTLVLEREDPETTRLLEHGAIIRKPDLVGIQRRLAERQQARERGGP